MILAHHDLYSVNSKSPQNKILLLRVLTNMFKYLCCFLNGNHFKPIETLQEEHKELFTLFPDSPDWFLFHYICFIIASLYPFFFLF